MKITAAHPLLDTLISTEKMRNDADIARELGIASPQISKMRHRRIEVSDTMRVAIQRRFRWPLSKIDKLAPPNTMSPDDE